MGDDPTGDPAGDRAGIVEDHVGEAITGDDSAADSGLEVAPVDRQRVVRHDGLEGVRDHLEDTLRVARRDQPLVHLEQPALAGDLVLELAALPVELVELRRVDDRLRRIAGEDREGRLVLMLEPARRIRRQDDHAVHVILEADRDREDGLGSFGTESRGGPRIRSHVIDEDRFVVGSRPARHALADGEAEFVPIRIRPAEEHAAERDRLAHRGLVIDPIDPDRLAGDHPLHAFDDQARDLGEAARPVQPDRQVLNRLEPACQRANGVIEPRVRHGGRHLVGEAAGERGLRVRPDVDRILVQDE